jgi:hypothetical protein
MRRLKLILMLTVIAGISLNPPATANGPAGHDSFPVAGDVFDCGDEAYTLTSGEVKVTFHEGESQSGNHNFTVTFTPSKVVGVDSSGNEVFIRGAGWFGGTFNAQQETEQFTSTFKLQIVEPVEGTRDSVNQTIHFTSVNENFKEVDFGECDAP